MANPLSNENAVKAFLLPKLQDAVQYVTDAILEKNRELIKQIIYEGYDPVIYERTHVFEEEWASTSEIKSYQSKASGKFEYDPFPAHIGIVDEEPIDEYLAEIIYDGLSGAIYQKGYAKDTSMFKGQAWTDKRSVWDALNKWLGVRQMKALLSQGLDKAGLNYNWHNVAMNVEKSND